MDQGTRKTDRHYGVPDEDTPELTADALKRAVPFPELLRRLGKKPLGRPKAGRTKTPVNLRLDPEIVAHFKAGGPGWQTRINAALGEVVRAARKSGEAQSAPHGKAAKRKAS